MDINKDNAKYISRTEKQVMEVLLQHRARADNVHDIATICGISDLQAAVAVQLLEHKKLIPPGDASK